jgi:hypothetical protein
MIIKNIYLIISSFGRITSPPELTEYEPENEAFVIYDFSHYIGHPLLLRDANRLLGLDIK